MFSAAHGIVPATGDIDIFVRPDMYMLLKRQLNPVKYDRRLQKMQGLCRFNDHVLLSA
jgi:hypothetical protein